MNSHEHRAQIDSIDEPSVDADDVWQERFRCLVGLSTDYYWEQDEHYRFTMLTHRDEAEQRRVAALLLGKTRWDVYEAPVRGSWHAHRATLEARAPYRDFEVRIIDTDGHDRYMSSSGQPIFAEQGRFLGYRGVTRDVTREKRDLRLLRLETTVARILAAANDAGADAALNAALQVICKSVGWEAGHYWRADETGKTIRFCAGWRIDGSETEDTFNEARNLSLKPGKGLIGRVWQQGKAIWVRDLSKESQNLRQYVVQRSTWNSALLFPVVAGGETIGVLDFNAPSIPEPDERLRKTLQVLGMQIASFAQRSAALKQLRQSKDLYASTVELAAIGISHVNLDGRFIQANRQLCEMLGYSKDELLSSTVKDISHPEDIDATNHDRARLHANEIASFKSEKRYLRKNGQSIWVNNTVAVKRDEDGNPLYDISITEDISERKRAEERVRYLATHDEMTGLPNRAMFNTLLSHAVEAAGRRGDLCAVLFIDLDRFKVINDSLGHAAGDALLKTIAARLTTRVRASDFLARLGGDEFVVLLDGIEEESDAAQAAKAILSATLEPLRILGHECRVTASIGIAIYPTHARAAAALMKNADIAMYLAKEEGRNNFQFYTGEINPMSVERLALEAHLRNALEHEELSIQYQPKVDFRTGAINGVEALLRWWNHELGTVSPVQFIPIAEDNGMIVPIGKWVLRSACEQNMEWQKRGLPPIVMAVNLSPRQFKDAELLSDIAEILEQTGMAPKLLELEITEGMIMNNLEQAAERLAAIKSLGVRLAIDDFGTGYSSLSQLKRFPIDTLKVDRSFIRDIPSNAEDKAITEAIISMGRTLGITVVAEGVEHAEQYAFLRDLGCDEMQGYYFSKPCHPDAVADLLQGAGSHETAATDGQRAERCAKMAT